MQLFGNLCLPQIALFSPCINFSTLLAHVRRTGGPVGSFGSALLSVRWNSTRQAHESGQIKRSIERLCMSFASTQSPNRPGAASKRSFWPSLLSELWLRTLRVTRDPEKIVKALRHSFASKFVVVLTEDDAAPSTSGSHWKTVGVGRAVSDRTFIATICDVAVDPAYRHRGIGRRIVKKLVENIKRTGGPSGFAVFPPPVAQQFFWMIGFRSDKKYKLMAYREKEDDKVSAADGTGNTETKDRISETE